jgi:adenylate cyclase
MTPQTFERKLTAILSADVAGYSRLMGEDEEFTIRTLAGHREMMSTLIEQHRGRVIDSPGDNLLAAFSSVTKAVDCAVEIQREMAERNEELPDDRKMEYRIGVNLGDVIEEGERIYGDGVNITARLETLAEPGGICISGIVYSQVKNRLKLEYEYLGKRTVKNISEPVPVYRILSLPKAVTKPGVQEERAYSLSDKPSIAVLPFANISGDPEQEYFSDGMTEELIGALAKLEGLKVISRTSAFHFKGKDSDLRTIGEKLKVKHVLEGSVRKAGNKLRISAQLIKVDDDTHLWSENYNRELKDVFAIQEEISQAIVKNLKVKLLGTQTEPLVKDYTKNTEAYELFLKGKYFENKGPSGYEKAIDCMEKAIKADPDYVPSYAYLATIYSMMEVVNSLPPWEMEPKINVLRQKALELDDNYAFAHVSLARKKTNEYDWKEAEKSYKRALELNPGHPDLHHSYSIYLAAVGHINEAILEIKRAIGLDPLSSFHRAVLGMFLFMAGQFDQAIEISQETLGFDPDNSWAIFSLAMGYAGKEMYDKAISTIHGHRNIPFCAAYLGYIYGKAGKIEEAQKILNDFLDRSKNGYFSPYMIATVYSGLGEKDKVFEWLDKAYEVREPWQALIKVDIVFHSLHSDPRWTEQLKKRGLAK